MEGAHRRRAGREEDGAGRMERVKGIEPSS